MHGRVKVRSAAEQETAKKLEQDKKMKQYKAALEQIFTKRDNNELDETLLKLTEEILIVNPDHYTVWNTRRDCINELIKPLNDVDKLNTYQKELFFLESCLKVNPKSYSSFLHRRWVMENISAPNWSREIHLCDVFLTHDERNFHCWDYRRYAVKKANISPFDELKFSQKKIESNFSNYSAWHYRSKLLPQCYPATTTEAPNISQTLTSSVDSSSVKEEQLLEEFELASNAFFTDPSDQSAWFYHKWLLGKSQQDPRAIFIIYNPASKTLSIVYNIAVMSSVIEQAVIVLNDKITTVKWFSCEVSSSWPSPVWRTVLECEHSSQQSISKHILCKFGSITYKLDCDHDKTSVLVTDIVENANLFEAPTSAKFNVIKSHCESITELLKLEPNNKWCQLTVLQLLWKISPEVSKDDILHYFQSLIKIDPYRVGYYRDLRSKFIFECQIKNFLKSDQFYNFSLRDLSLTRLHFTQFISHVTCVDLSSNKLTTTRDLSYLISCEELNLDFNQLSHISSDIAHLIQLRILSLRHNLLTTLDSITSLQRVRTLKKLMLEGNPVTINNDVINITDMFPTLNISVNNNDNNDNNDNNNNIV